MLNWKDRIRAAGIHLGLSLAVAALAGALVFGLWYPYPYREISGGRELFLIVMAVDVTIGPLITFAIFNRAKSDAALRRDLGVVALLQMAALGYGLYTVFVARPVHLVFEYNRFRVIHAVEVPVDMLPSTPAGIDALPLLGPTQLSLRPFKSDKEGSDATLAALQGLSLSARPDLWQTYEAGRAEVLSAARPVGELRQRFAARAPEIDRAVASTGRPPDKLAYIPVAGRKDAWTVFVDAATAQIVAFAPIDSF